MDLATTFITSKMHCCCKAIPLLVSDLLPMMHSVFSAGAALYNVA